MQPEDTPRALPLVVVIYGQLRNADPSSPPFPGGNLDVFGRISLRGAGLGAQLALPQGELVGSGARVLAHRELRIDTASRTVTFRSTPIHLRRREYDLLVYLLADPTRVYTRHELLRDVWGFKQDGATRTLDTHATRLRQALTRAGAVGWVRSTRGVGYRLAP